MAMAQPFRPTDTDTFIPSYSFIPFQNTTEYRGARTDGRTDIKIDSLVCFRGFLQYRKLVCVEIFETTNLVFLR